MWLSKANFDLGETCVLYFQPGGLSERFQHKLQDFGRISSFLRQNDTGLVAQWV